MLSAQQETEDTPSPLPTATTLSSIPLDLTRRAALEQAIKARDYSRAESALAEEIERQPKSSQLLAFLGNVLFLDGKYLDSAIAMKKADALVPLDNRNRFVLAMAYVTLQHADWARPELEELAHSDPRNALYPYWLSRLDYADMHLADAVYHARKAIHLDPTFMKAYDNLGLYYEGLGKTDEAMNAYEQAVRLNREQGLHSPWPSMNLAALLVKLDRQHEAAALLKESLNEDPGFPKAHFRLGLLLEKQKNYPEAIAELKQAATFDPSYPEPHYILARIYRLLGDLKSAESAFRTFQALRDQEKKKAVHRSH